MRIFCDRQGCWVVRPRKKHEDEDQEYLAGREFPGDRHRLRRDSPAFPIPAYKIVNSLVEIPLHSLMGVVMGLVAVLHVHVFYTIRDRFAALGLHQQLKPLVGVLALGGGRFPGDLRRGPAGQGLVDGVGEQDYYFLVLAAPFIFMGSPL